MPVPRRPKVRSLQKRRRRRAIRSDSRYRDFGDTQRRESTLRTTTGRPTTEFRPPCSCATFHPKAVDIASRYDAHTTAVSFMVKAVWSGLGRPAIFGLFILSHAPRFLVFSGPSFAPGRVSQSRDFNHRVAGRCG